MKKVGVASPRSRHCQKSISILTFRNLQHQNLMYQILEFFLFNIVLSENFVILALEVYSPNMKKEAIIDLSFQACVQLTLFLANTSPRTTFVTHYVFSSSFWPLISNSFPNLFLRPFSLCYKEEKSERKRRK